MTDTTASMPPVPEFSVMAGVDLDLTALLATGIFLLVFVLLKVTLFDPYLKIVRRRDQLMLGARDEAALKTREAEAVLETYEKRISDARSEGAKLREEVRIGAEKQRDEMLSVARADAQAVLMDRRAATADELATARERLDAEADALSASIVQRILPAA